MSLMSLTSHQQYCNKLYGEWRGFSLKIQSLAHLGICRDVVGSLAVVRALVQPPPYNNNIIVIINLLLLFTWWSRSRWGRGNCSRTWSRIWTCTSRTRTPWPHSPQPEMRQCSFWHHIYLDRCTFTTISQFGPGQNRRLGWKRTYSMNERWIYLQ